MAYRYSGPLRGRYATTTVHRSNNNDNNNFGPLGFPAGLGGLFVPRSSRGRIGGIGRIQGDSRVVGWRGFSLQRGTATVLGRRICCWCRNIHGSTTVAAVYPCRAIVQFRRVSGGHSFCGFGCGLGIGSRSSSCSIVPGRTGTGAGAGSGVGIGFGFGVVVQVVLNPVCVFDL